MGAIQRTLTLIDVLTKTKSDAELLLAKLLALSKTGTAWVLQWDADGAGSLFKWDGTSTTLNVLQVGDAAIEKDNPSGVYKFSKIVFEEANK